MPKIVQKHTHITTVSKHHPPHTHTQRHRPSTANHNYPHHHHHHGHYQRKPPFAKKLPHTLPEPIELGYTTGNGGSVDNINGMSMLGGGVGGDGHIDAAMPISLPMLPSESLLEMTQNNGPIMLFDDDDDISSDNKHNVAASGFHASGLDKRPKISLAKQLSSTLRKQQLLQQILTPGMLGTTLTTTANNAGGNAPGGFAAFGSTDITNADSNNNSIFGSGSDTLEQLKNDYMARIMLKQQLLKPNKRKKYGNHGFGESYATKMPQSQQQQHEQYFAKQAFESPLMHFNYYNQPQAQKQKQQQQQQQQQQPYSYYNNNLYEHSTWHDDDSNDDISDDTDDFEDYNADNSNAYNAANTEEDEFFDDKTVTQSNEHNNDFNPVIYPYMYDAFMSAAGKVPATIAASTTSLTPGPSTMSTRLKWEKPAMSPKAPTLPFNSINSNIAGFGYDANVSGVKDHNHHHNHNQHQRERERHHQHHHHNHARQKKRKNRIKSKRYRIIV